jgi:uncharacterized protein (TIGR02217 family)
MAFIETPRFPDDISYGSAGGPMYNTIVIKLKSGVEVHNINWSYPQHRFDVAYGIKNMSLLYALISFFHSMAGRGHGFRYKDFADCCSAGDYTQITSIAANDQHMINNTTNAVGTDAAPAGDGSTVAFTLAKTYLTGTIARVRVIKKPVSGTVRVALDDVEKLQGDATYPWSIDTATGIITFTSTAPGNGVKVEAGYEFDVPCWFETDELSTQLSEYASGEINIPVVEDKYPS